MTIHEESDSTAAKKGDREAFARLYDAYVRQVYGFIYTKVHHTPTAEDLTSQVFVKALEHIARFDVKKASFKTWLFTIARRTVIDYYRTNHHESHIEDAWDFPADSSVLRDADIAVRFAKVQTVMKALSMKDRDLIMLRIWQDLSFEEMSEIVGSSPDACKVAYGRAIQKIRNQMPEGIAVLTFLLISRIV